MSYKKRNINTFTCKGIDLYERYDRVFNFMTRTSKYYHANRQLKWWQNFIKDVIDEDHKKDILKYIDKCKLELEDAKERRIYLTHKTLKDMSEGIINNLTQGIWLSYPHIKYNYYFDEYKNKYFIIKLNTGEEFLCRQKWKEYSDHRGRYDFFKQKWITKNPIIKHYYLKPQIIKKLN